MKLKCIGGYFNGKYKDISFKHGDLVRFQIIEPFEIKDYISTSSKEIAIKYDTYIISILKYYDEATGWYEVKFLRHADLSPGQAFELAFK